MSSLVNWSCSWRLMAGGQQEPIFVKGLKTESRCLGYMSEMSRKEAVLQLTQTKGSLRANWSKRLEPSHGVPGRMGFRRAEWQSQRNKDLHRGRAESFEGWNSTACLYTAWQAVVLISSHLQTEGESASLCWPLLGSVATKAGREHPALQLPVGRQWLLQSNRFVCSPCKSQTWSLWENTPLALQILYNEFRTHMGFTAVMLKITFYSVCATIMSCILLLPCVK